MIFLGLFSSESLPYGSLPFQSREYLWTAMSAGCPCASAFRCLFWWQGLSRLSFMWLDTKGPIPLFWTQIGFWWFCGTMWMRHGALGFHYSFFRMGLSNNSSQGSILMVWIHFNFTFFLRNILNLTQFKKCFQVMDFMQLQISKHQQWILFLFFLQTFLLLLCIQPIVYRD